MSAPIRPPIVLAPGQVWHTPDGDSRTVLRVFPKDERGSAVVRVRINGERVSVIASATLRAWIGKHQAAHQ